MSESVSQSVSHCSRNGVSVINVEYELLQLIVLSRLPLIQRFLLRVTVIIILVIVSGKKELTPLLIEYQTVQD